VGAHPSFLRLLGILHEEEAKYAIERAPTMVAGEVRTEGNLRAFYDDATVSGELEVLYRVGHRAAAAFRPDGLELVPSKCEILGAAVDIAADPPDGFQLRDDGVKILGVPVGTLAYRNQKFEDLIQKATPYPEVFKVLDERMGHRLLSCTYNNELVYVTRIVEHGDRPVVHPALRAYDGAIDRCLATLVGIPQTAAIPERVAILRAQRHCCGGLGMQRYYGVTTERNMMLSRVRATHHVDESCQALRRVIDNPSVYCPIHLGATEQQAGLQAKMEEALAAAEREPLEAEEDEDIGTRNAALYARLAAVTKEAVRTVIEKHYHDYLLAKLLAGNERDNAAYLRSASTKGTGRFLLNTTGLVARGKYFSGGDFKLALTQRLLLPLWPASVTGPRHCGCGGRHGILRTNLTQRPHHEQSCTHGGGIRTKRHHMVKDSAVALVAKCLGVHVRDEVRYQKQPTTGVWSESPPLLQPMVGRPGADTIIADIQYTHKGKVYLLDIAIVDPAADMHLAAGSAETAAVAAKAEETRKRAKYSAAFPSIQSGATVFYPIVLEATGRLGPSALMFLDTLYGPEPVEPAQRRFIERKINRFRDEVAMTLARTGAWLCQAVNQHQG
jgi:hypothetical protein